MGKKQNRVFDKKNSITFRLISQPIQTQETVIQNKVLVVAAKPNQTGSADASKLAQIEKEFGGSVTFKDGKAPISIYDPNYQWREDEEIVEYEEFEEDDEGEAYDDLDDDLDFDGAESVDLSDLEKEFGEADLDGEESVEEEEEERVFKGKKPAKNKRELIGVIGSKKEVELDDAALDRILTENASKYKSKRQENNDTNLQEILEQNPNAYMKNVFPLPNEKTEARFFINNDDTNDQTIAEDMRQALDGDYQSDEFEEFDDDFFAQLNADTLSDEEGTSSKKKSKTKKPTQKKDIIPETKEGKIDVGKMLQQEENRRRGIKEEEEDFDDDEFLDEEEEEYIPKQTKKTPFDKVYGEAFEKILERYDEDEIGDLEGHTDDDIHGQLEINQISHLINEFIYNSSNINADDILSDDEEYDGVKRPKLEDLLMSDRFKQLEAELAKEGLRVLTPEESLRRKQLRDGNNITQKELAELILKRLEYQEQKQDKEEEDEEYEYIKRKPREKWDCQTIVSTYSNLENHPTLIKEESRKIRLSKKTGMPLGVLEAQKTEEEQLHEELEEHDPENIKVNLGEGRAKTETKEEKLLRKKVMQEYKKQKRHLKKTVKEAFKEEEKKQSKLNAMPHTRQRVVLKYE